MTVSGNPCCNDVLVAARTPSKHSHSIMLFPTVAANHTPSLHPRSCARHTVRPSSITTSCGHPNSTPLQVRTNIRSSTGFLDHQAAAHCTRRRNCYLSIWDLTLDKHAHLRCTHCRYGCGGSGGRRRGTTAGRSQLQQQCLQLPVVLLRFPTLLYTIILHFVSLHHHVDQVLDLDSNVVCADEHPIDL